MKQPKSRPSDDNSREKPASQTVSQAHSPAGCRPLNQQAEPLEQEVSCWHTVTGVCRQRDDQFVNQTRNEKNEQRSLFRPDAPPQRIEGVTARELMECRVPAPRPKIRQRLRQNRRAHDGLRVKSCLLPSQCKQVEQTEMKNEG